MKILIASLLFSFFYSFADNTGLHEITNNNYEVEPPAFSENAGFYSDAFDLYLYGDDNDIYYTLDGSDPCISDNSVLYTEPIKIYDNTNEPNIVSAVEDISLSNRNYKAPAYNVDKGIIVKAACKSSTGEWSDVVACSYFVGKTKKYYQDMMVISLSFDYNDLFDTSNGIYMIGDDYYKWLESDEYDSQMTVWNINNPTNFYKRGIESERTSFVEFFEDGKLVYKDCMGLRIAGNGSRAYPQKSFRLYPRKSYGKSSIKYPLFDGLTDYKGNDISAFKRLTIRSGGNDCNKLHFRDDLIQELVNDLDFTTQASRDCIIFLNGELWGHYSLKERYDKYYLSDHFGVDKDNVAIIEAVNASYVDSDDKNELQIYNDFYDWAINTDMRIEENYKELCERIDVRGLMDMVAVQSYICNFDGEHNNWRIWKTITSDSNVNCGDCKYRFMLYDTENSTNGGNDLRGKANYDWLKELKSSDDSVHIYSIFLSAMENADFRREFDLRYREIINNNFDTQKVNEKITEYADNQKEAVKDTLMHFFGANSMKQYDTRLNGLKSFFTERPDYALKYLDSFIASYEAHNTGDINGDKKVDASDATMVISDYSLISTGERTGLTFSQRKAADMNTDGKIDASDATAILQEYSRLSTGDC